MVIREYERNNCIIEVKLTPENWNRLASLPGFKKWEGRSLIFRPTGANIAYIRQYWPDADWSGDSRIHLDKYIEQIEAAALTRAARLRDLTDTSGFQYKTIPYKHQEKALILSRDKINFALLMEQGTGKTKVILDNAAYLYSRGLIDALVVVAPNGAHRNWVDNEIPDHLPDWCAHFDYFHKSNLTQTWRSRLQQVMEADNRLRVFSLHVEGFTSEKGKKILEDCLQKFRCMMVVDESTCIKNSGAKRTKYLVRVGKWAAYRRILTGTPITRGAEDLYTQFLFLDPMILGFDSFYTFRNHFCLTNRFHAIIGYQNLDELAQLIEGHSFRVLKSECLDLPPKVYKRWPIELGPEQRRVYDDLRKEYIAQFEQEEIVEELAITRLMRLQQIACNWWPGAEDGVLRPIETPNPRLQALQTILENVIGKVIIWARFRSDLEMITRTLGKQVVPYYGGISSDARAASYRRFQEDDSVQYFVGNPRSAGRSLTLTAASTVVYYSNMFDLEFRLQSEDRAHRIGQVGDSVVYYDIDAVRTVDQNIIKALRSHKNVSDMVMKDPRSFFLDYDQFAEAT